MFLTFVGLLVLVGAFFVPREFEGLNTGRIKAFMRLVSVPMIVAGVFLGGFQYAEPGYIYHVRDIFGTERVVSKTGWFFAGWRDPIPWKREVTIAYDHSKTDGDTAGAPSSQLLPYTITMADNVKGTVTAVVRFRVPDDIEQFLEIAHRYRSPGRLVSTALKPSVEQAFDATASLVTAEGYFTSERNQFKQKFRQIMQKGIPATRRTQKRIPVAGSDVGATGTNLPGAGKTGDTTRLVYVLEEIKDKDGVVIRTRHNFQLSGINVADAILTQFDADDEFEERIQERRDAAAKRAIAREKRLEEEEQRLYEVARGQKEIAIEHAKVKKDQIARETKAETDKKLAVISAEKLLRQAEIDKQTAEIALEKARIDAQSIKTLADANAYERQKLLEADGALKPKLDAFIEVNKEWASAYSNRRTPSIVFGSGGESSLTGAPTGANSEATEFQSMLNALIAKQLLLDTTMKPIE